MPIVQYRGGLGTMRFSMASQFGCNFKVQIAIDDDLIRPCGKISGNVLIDTRFPISHFGLLVQFEAMCSLRYTSKLGNQTNFQHGKEMILEGARHRENFFYFESPIQHVISQFKSGDASTAHIIPTGLNSYPFSLTIPENTNLPLGFRNEFGSLVYRLAVYIKNVTGYQIYMEVGDKTVRFNGHCNLLNIELKPISIERFYCKSMFSRKKVVETHFSVESSGFLLGECIPFKVEYKNPKCYPLHIFVRFVQNLTYNAANKHASLKSKSKIVKTVYTQIKDDTTPESVWKDTLHIPDSQEPSYKAHFMYSVTYTLQLIVKIFLETGEQVIKGEAPIYIGTTREPDQLLMNSANNLNVPYQGVPRRGSASSTYSATTTYSLPPAYSQLSSRIASMETLPPSYDEAEFSDNDNTLLALEVPTDRQLATTPEIPEEGAEKDEQEDD